MASHLFAAPFGQQYEYLTKNICQCTADVFKKDTAQRTPLHRYFINARVAVLAQQRDIKQNFWSPARRYIGSLQRQRMPQRSTPTFTLHCIRPHPFGKPNSRSPTSRQPGSVHAHSPHVASVLRTDTAHAYALATLPHTKGTNPSELRALLVGVLPSPLLSTTSALRRTRPSSHPTKLASRLPEGGSQICELSSAAPNLARPFPPTTTLQNRSFFYSASRMPTANLNPKCSPTKFREIYDASVTLRDTNTDISLSCRELRKNAHTLPGLLRR